jgi:xanthine/CO dehydrogenase XdhC/CoxF family maturation factor
MRDALAILAAASILRQQRAPFLVATVVRVEGSSYRRPGARLVTTEEGRVAGSISGGCLERDLVRTGFWRTRSGPALVRYDSRDLDEGEPVLGCGGVVEVLLERGDGGDDDDPLALVSRILSGAIAAEAPLALATIFRTTDPSLPLAARWTVDRDGRVDGALSAPEPLAAALAKAAATAIASERAAALALTTGDGSIDVLVEPIVPPPHLFVFGAGADVLPLVATARSLGWRTTVWVPPASTGARARLAAAGAAVEGDLAVLQARIDATDRSMAVVMAHDLTRDREALGAVLASRAGYIGVLGPRHRAASLGADDDGSWLADPRVHAPVGLDLGAETPEEIALAIASEILARIRGGSGEALRRRATIHRDPP